MCEVYPSRRQELDAYERDIVEMASTTRGSAFYEYQKAFSARASALLLQRNINIDWSIRDTKLFATIFAGQTVVRCELCGSVTHATHSVQRRRWGLILMLKIQTARQNKQPVIWMFREDPKFHSKEKRFVITSMDQTDATEICAIFSTFVRNVN